MKKLFSTLLIACSLMVPSTVSAASVASSRSSVDVKSTLSINADGTAVIQSRTIQSRAMTEEQIRQWEQWIKRMKEREEGEAPSKKEPAAAESAKAEEPKPMDDKEIETRLKAIYQHSSERAEEEDAPTRELNEVKVEKDTVEIIGTQKFPSLEEMLKAGYGFFSYAGLWFQNIRIETDTEGKLRLTLTPYKDSKKDVAKEWKSTGSKAEMKIVLPGKIISSGFPKAEENATWVTIDSKDDATLQEAAKLYAGPVVITSEPGGLKLAEPLDAKAIQRAAYRPKTGYDDIPVTEARSGFVVESTSLTTTTVQYFNNGEAMVKKFRESVDAPGLVVEAKVFPPKGSTIKSVSDIKVISAVDDKGRDVTAAKAGDDEENEFNYFSSSSSSDGKSSEVQLRLQLPAPDAQSVDELSAEAIAVTVGSWKEIVITNAASQTNKEIDLSDLVPGAKATLTKVQKEDNSFEATVKITGPKGIKVLELDGRITGSEDTNSHSSERSSNTKGEQVVRTMSVQAYAFSPDERKFDNMDVVIKLPQDLRRERVKFKLTALDLF